MTTDAIRFEQGQTLFLDGLKDFAAGRLTDAERRFTLSLELVPDRPSTLLNLAAVQLKLLRPQAALDAVAQVLAIEPKSGEAWFHHGCAMTQLGQAEVALESFEHAGAFIRNSAEPWFRHGQLLQGLDRDENALRSYERAVAADEHFAPAWSNIGTLLRELGRLDEAAHAFSRARGCGADAQLHDYYLAAVGHGTVPKAAPARYVETLFDEYADSFAGHVVDVLGYRAHTMLSGALKEFAPDRKFSRAVDLGCGTGLLGSLLQPITQHLIGVDLSTQMLVEAKASGAYDLLVQQELVEFLNGEHSTFDLVAAADVLIYVGDLSAAFAAVHRVLSADGIFCFSVELAPPHGL